MQNKVIQNTVMYVTCLALTACGSSSSDPGNSPTAKSSSPGAVSSASSSSASNAPVAITIPFEAFSGSTEIKCGVALEGLGTVSTRATVADFRFYIHNLLLVTSTGVELPIALDENGLQVDNIALLDFRDKLGTGTTSCQGDANPALNKKITGKVLIGNNTVSSLRFVLGVPATHNHTDQTAAKEPLKTPGLSSGMHWGWNIGYKFTGIDLFTDVAITRPGDATWTNNRWNIHLGSTGCTGAAAAGEKVVCTAENRAEITLNDFVVGKSVVKLDLAKIVAKNNLGQDIASSAGCMSGATDSECAEIFASFGLSHATQTSSPLAQTVFSLVTQ
ncbi:MAG: metallo-mystery pair system four-Cys motif protein [Cellvibrio sp. 79]|nr:MAG: metallo-mystery pair system four-Cys motif protein [Cellvibrio sp. 79]